MDHLLHSYVFVRKLLDVVKYRPLAFIACMHVIRDVVVLEVHLAVLLSRGQDRLAPNCRLIYSQPQMIIALVCGSYR